MAITAGSNLNSVAAPQKQALNSNYLDLATGSADTLGWAQQYVPDLMEKEAEVFGNRTISGFLSQVGAEESMTADQVVWSEQGRLHLAYKCSMIDADQGIGGDHPGCEIEILTDMDGQDPGLNHGVRVNDTVIVAGGTGQTFKGVVTQVNTSGDPNITPTFSLSWFINTHVVFVLWIVDVNLRKAWDINLA